MRKKICLPTLYPLNRDLQKTWFVKFYTPAGKLVKLYGKLAWYHTVKEKEAEGRRIIEEVINPGINVQGKKKTDLASLICAQVEYKKPSLEPKSYENYFGIAKAFTLWCRDLTTQNKPVQPAEFAMHLFSKGLHKNTVRNRIIILSGLAKELIKAGKLIANPFADIKIKKVKATSKLPFTSTQVQQIKTILMRDKQLWLASQFMYYLYLRPKELRHLKIGDILFEDKKIILSGLIAKDDDTIIKAIPVPLQPVTAALEVYPANFYIFSKNGLPGATILGRDNLSKRVKAILIGLNFSHRYTFYSFCHTGIKNAAMSGIPIKQLQLQKGHADLKMFDEYLKDLGINDCTQLVTQFPAL